MQIAADAPEKRKISGVFGAMWHAWRKSTSETGWFGEFLRLFVLIAFALYFGMPVLWLLFAPSKSDPQLFDLPPLSIGAIDRYLVTWNNLMSFGNGSMVRWALNSAYYVTASLIFSLIITVPAGYILAIARFPGRNVVLWATLITMMMPGSALVLPLFLEMNLFGLTDTPWAVILPAVFFPFGTYLTYIYYATSLPRDILDAARVDGCTEVDLFRFVGLPLSFPLLGLLAFISFNGNWNNYFGPFVMLNDSDYYNLPVGIQALISGTNAIRPTISASDLPLHRAEVAMSGLFLVLPVVIVFIFAQRYVVSGAFTGSIKG